MVQPSMVYFSCIDGHPQLEKHCIAKSVNILTKLNKLIQNIESNSPTFPRNSTLSTFG